MGKTEDLAIINCLQKKNMTPEGTLALNCYRNLLIDHIQPRLTFICSQTRITPSWLPLWKKKIRVVEECLANQGANDFREGIAVHEYDWPKYIDVKGGGGAILKIMKSCLDCATPSW